MKTKKQTKRSRPKKIRTFHAPKPYDEKDGYLNSAILYRMLESAMLPDIGKGFHLGLLGTPPRIMRDYGLDDVEEAPDLRAEVTWTGPAATLATIRPPLRGTASFRGALVNDADYREVVFASTIERDLAYVLQADHRVSSFQEQPERQEYVDRNGVIRHHTFDFLVQLVDGTKVAMAVKPEELRESSGIDEVIELFREQRPHGFADAYVVRSRKQITHVVAYNSRLILVSRRLRDDADVARLTACFAKVYGAVDLCVMLEQFGAEDTGFTAAVNLIDDGILEWVSGGRINHGGRVRYLPKIN